MIKDYYYLTKPGIIYGNILTAAAGFLMASAGHIDLPLLIETMLGTSLVIASACVVNNYIDRDIDRAMARTSDRSLVTGKVSNKSAIIYSIILGIVGVTILYVFTNNLVVLIGLIAFIDYVILYGWTKRHSVYGTLVGSISGAAPIVAGYCAVTGKFDLTAFLLFLILVLWQMPHFYSIAIYRFKDYKNAKIPVLPVFRSIKSAKQQIIVYIVGFIVILFALKIYSHLNYFFIISTVLVGLVWLVIGLKGYNSKSDSKWARKMFFLSLIVIMVLSLALSVSKLS